MVNGVLDAACTALTVQRMDPNQVSLGFKQGCKRLETEKAAAAVDLAKYWAECCDKIDKFQTFLIDDSRPAK